MRLLQRLQDDAFELISFDDEHPPLYAILSHTWVEGQEVTYDELVAGVPDSKNKSGYAKLRFCADQAAVDGIQYFWVDTCCINKSINNELSTAINSMFRWYQRAAKCYVYLSDVSVSPPTEDVETQAISMTWKDAFLRSRWFTRGWTLQELLAPSHVEFFSCEGGRLGTRKTLEQEIHQVTAIPVEVLRDQSVTDYSIEERMSWAAARTTTFKEDKVYCLLGIFGVFLPLIYGEGVKYATRRLEEEIARRQKRQGTGDQRHVPLSNPLPFARNERFDGREDQLKALKEMLFSPSTHMRMTIYGLGGCGKSALALEFAYRSLADRVADRVFWVPAMSRNSFELAYREIANSLRILGKNDESNEDVNRLVKTTLSASSSGSWIIVVDNADNPAVLRGADNGTPGSANLSDFLPCSPQGAILFTTRSRKAAQTLTPNHVLELKDMNQAEARKLLASRITEEALLDNSQAIEQLLGLLTCLPLAIVQAAAFMNSNGISVSKYVSLFKHADAETELFSEQFEDPSRYESMDSTIAKTWHMSFAQIRKQDPRAAEYLSFIACVDRIKVPQSLLPYNGPQVQQLKALGTLTGYAFITEHQQMVQGPDRERFFDMHRLVHKALITWLKEHGDWVGWTRIAANRLEVLLPYGGHEKKEVWTSYIPHAMCTVGHKDTIEGRLQVSLLDRVGRCQESLGQYASAEVSHRRGLVIRKKLFGGEHLATLTSVIDVARVLHRQGKYEEAEAMNRETLARYKKGLGPEHPETLTSMNSLALVLDSQGKYEEAEAMYREILASISYSTGELSMQGMYEETETEMINRELLARRMKVLGSEHPCTLTVMSNLAAVLNSQGRYEESETLNRETLAWREKLLGPEHPDTLTDMNNLALVLSKRKDKEAEIIYRETLKRSEKVLGPQHPDVLTTMNNLALVVDSQGKLKDAEVIHRQTLEQRETVLGREHPDTLMSVYHLAHVLARQHYFTESWDLFERACAGYLVTLGTDHPTTRACRQHYIEASAYAKRQQLDQVSHPSRGGSTSSDKKTSKFTRGITKIQSKFMS